MESTTGRRCSTLTAALIDGIMTTEGTLKTVRMERKELEKLARTARRNSVNIWFGLASVVLSFFENSYPWTAFILLTGWIGVVMGLSGGVGFADYLLNRQPAHRHVSKRAMIGISLITFWIPALCVALFGIGLAGGLAEGLQPKSHIHGREFVLIIQVFAMFFLAAGTTWAIVAKEVRMAIEMSSGGKSIEA